MEKEPYKLRLRDFRPIKGFFGYHDRVDFYYPNIEAHAEIEKKAGRRLMVLAGYNASPLGVPIAIGIFKGLEHLLK